MTAKLKTYRFYTVGADGKYAGLPKFVDCSGDREAVSRAAQKIDGIAVEIWEASRLVALLPQRGAAGDSKKAR